MHYRQLGRSGLRVSVLTLGTMTFGGKGVFAKTGDTDLAGARRLVDRCLEAGVNLFDTADVYSWGGSEEMLGEALRGRRDRSLVTTKARMRMGDGPNDAGLSRHHLVACLRGQPAAPRHRPHRPLPAARLGRPDAAGGDAAGAGRPGPCRQGPLRRLLELLGLALDEGAGRQPSGSAWSASSPSRSTTRWRRARPSTSWCPIAVDQGVGILVWSPLAGGLLTGKYRRDRPDPPGSRHLNDWGEPPIRDEGRLHAIVDELVASPPGAAAASPPPRSRWPGCSAGRACAPRWWSGRATRRSSTTTWVPPTSS